MRRAAGRHRRLIPPIHGAPPLAQTHARRSRQRRGLVVAFHHRRSTVSCAQLTGAATTSRRRRKEDGGAAAASGRGGRKGSLQVLVLGRYLLTRTSAAATSSGISPSGMRAFHRPSLLSLTPSVCWRRRPRRRRLPPRLWSRHHHHQPAPSIASPCQAPQLLSLCSGCRCRRMVCGPGPAPLLLLLVRPVQSVAAGDAAAAAAGPRAPPGSAPGAR